MCHDLRQVARFNLKFTLESVELGAMVPRVRFDGYTLLHLRLNTGFLHLGLCA